MPNTRRQSVGPSTPKPSSSSSSQTPTPSTRLHHRTADEIMLEEADHILHPHIHHQTADELAIQEAESILGGTVSPAMRSGRLRGESSTPSGKGRKAALVVELEPKVQSTRKQYTPSTSSKLRKEKEDTGEDESEDRNNASALLDNAEEKSVGSEIEGHHVVELGTPTGSSQTLQEDLGSVREDAGEGEEGEEEEEEVAEDQSSNTEPIVPQVSAVIDATEVDGDSGEDAGSSGSSSADSSTDHGSDSSEDEDEDGDTSDTSDSEDEAEEEERLEKLLAAAKLSAQNTSSGVIGLTIGSGADTEDDDMLRLDADDEARDAPIPRMIINNLPAPSLKFSSTGVASAQAGPSKPSTTSSRRSQVGVNEDGRAVELDNREYQRPLTKKEKANQPKKATPSELWSSLPTARSDLVPQMKRDYQALALANSMDPKRFMKGGTKVNKVPESFAIGTLVEPPRHLQATTLTREQKYRPGQLVQGVVEDAGLGEYSKRKFGDLQWKRMENGRGKGWKKRAKW